MSKENKQKLSDAAYRLGFERFRNGQPAGDITVLLNHLADAMERRTVQEIRDFLYAAKKER